MPRRGSGAGSPARVAAAIRKRKIIVLRAAGLTESDIAEQVGISRQGVHKAIAKWMQDCAAEDEFDGRAAVRIEIERLLRVLRAAWPILHNDPGKSGKTYAAKEVIAAGELIRKVVREMSLLKGYYKQLAQSSGDDLATAAQEFQFHLWLRGLSPETQKLVITALRAEEARRSGKPADTIGDETWSGFSAARVECEPRPGAIPTSQLENPDNHSR